MQRLSRIDNNGLIEMVLGPSEQSKMRAVLPGRANTARLSRAAAMTLQQVHLASRM